MIFSALAYVKSFASLLLGAGYFCPATVTSGTGSYSSEFLDGVS